VAAKGLAPSDVVQAVLASNVLAGGLGADRGTQYDGEANSSPDSVKAFTTCR